MQYRPKKIKKIRPPVLQMWRRLKWRATRPLYVTATGMDECTATDLISRMLGPNWIPTILKRADTLARTA